MIQQTTKLLLAICLLSACNSTTHENEQSSVDSATTINDQRADNNANKVNDKDAEFAVMAADAGMTEVAMGKLALSKTQDPMVKAFAQMMITDHEQANTKLKAIAAAKNITLPAEPGKDHLEHMEDMNKKIGKDFDHHYMDMMVNDHNKVVDEFKKESTESENGDLKAFATETLPTLVKHQEEAKKTLEALDKKK